MSLAKVKRKKKPEGWDILEPTLETIESKMRDVEASTAKASEIIKLHHQRSRFVYEMFVKKVISKELYQWCVNEKVIDGALVAKWKKDGYESLCCLQCIDTTSTNFGTVCICRTPKHELDPGKMFVECKHCGCRGCASGD